MSDELFSCDECHADFGHRPDCSRRVPEKPIGCPQCGLLGGHARGCAAAIAALPQGLQPARGLHALIPTGDGDNDAAVFAGRPVIAPFPKPKLRALTADEKLPPLADAPVVDRIISSLLAEDARARSCLPESPSGWHWEAALEVRPNGTAALGEVRLRIAYRLMED